jgi:hypothetical protein
LLMEAIENREAINIEFFLQQAELFLPRYLVPERYIVEGE